MPPLFRPADHGRKNVNLAGDATKITAEDATIAATAGDANLSNAAVAAGSFEASATQNLTAENLAVTVGTDETGAAGDVTITATTGDVALTDAKLTGTEGGVGDVAVSAGGNAQLDGLMKAENGFAAESVAITAGDTVNFGDAPQSVSSRRATSRSRLPSLRAAVSVRATIRLHKATSALTSTPT